jgi:hypothetical protein
MEAKAILATKVKLNQLADSHNKLTTLVAVMLSELKGLRDEMESVRSLLENVEVVSEGGSAPVAPSPRVVATPPPPPPVQVRHQPVAPIQTASASASASRGRGGGRSRSSLAELHADDIIKQLNINTD